MAKEWDAGQTSPQPQQARQPNPERIRQTSSAPAEHPLFARCSTLAAAGLSLLLVGCADSSYLLQSVRGHLQLLQAARPVDQWLADETTSPMLKQRLLLAQRIRHFAVKELHLPDNASYQHFAQLQRRAVVWNVVAAPEYSLTLQTWCFPVAGCVGYRGYFDEQAAHEQAQALQNQGLEVNVYPVPAYSTLGWLNWAGGDPLLSTFIHYPQGELARMIFHELAHQVVYVKDDTTFNESFATAVERLGVTRWLATQADAAAHQEYTQHDTRRRAFRALTHTTRQRLSRIYEPNSALAPEKQAQAAMKSVAYREFREAYATLRRSWGDTQRMDDWVARANNAAFGALAAYDDKVAAFETLFSQQQGDWQAFYAAVKTLAQLAPQERNLRLQALNASTTHPIN